MQHKAHARLAALAIAFALASAAVPAQCGIEWTATNQLAGVDGDVLAAATWDPDGAGPAVPLVVLGGGFDVAGPLRTRGIVFHDLQAGTWSTENCPLEQVQALLVAPSGDLLVAGLLPGSGYGVGRYDGSSWTMLGLAAFDAPVQALTVAGNGDVFAGGGFSFVGPQLAGGIARFDGSSWQSLGPGMNAAVEALATLPNGDVVAGGGFLYANGQLVDRLARWNGSSWSSLGGVGGIVHALRTTASGDLLVGGEFSGAGGVPANHVARWNGTWSAVGNGIAWLFARVDDLVEMPNGDVVAVGRFGDPSGSGSNDVHVARFDGASWSPIGAGVGSSGQSFTPQLNAATVTTSGELVVGGRIRRAGTREVFHVAAWRGGEWTQLGSGMTGSIVALASMPDGTVVLGGNFKVPGQPGVVARWDGSALSPLGSGIAGVVYDLVATDSGELIAAGMFQTAGGVSAPGLARWDGAAWSNPYGTGISGWAQGVALAPNGDLVAVGSWMTPSGTTLVQRFDGQGWLTLASTVTGGYLMDVATLPNGDIVVVGSFTSIDGVAANRVARHDGNGWQAMGQGLPIWSSVVEVLSNGDLYALGIEPRRWNGSGWQPVATLTGINSATAAILCLHEMPNGDLLLGGTFGAIDGVAAERLARWDGAGYRAFGSLDNVVWGIAPLGDGTLVLHGQFETPGAIASPMWVEVASTCPATATSLGGGCPSSGGGNQLAARTLPWLGSTFRADAVGLPSSGLALGVTGFGTLSLPLATALPSNAGCDLMTTVDATELLLIAGGTATTSLLVPSTPTLVGVTLRHQVIPFELDSNGAIVSVTSTNALEVVLGDL